MDTQDTNQPQNFSSPVISRGPNASIAKIVIISFLFGLGGGALGGNYVVRHSQVSTPTGSNSKITLVEDSAIIEVVKKDSPAVVSIVISEDLNKISGYGNNPFGGDFAFPFFESTPKSNNTTPNIQQVGAGSGFFITSDGLILTNKHVVDNTSASYTVLTSDGKKYDAKVMSRDPSNDLAVVKIDVKNAPYLNLVDSNSLQTGQRVIAIGNSLGQYQNTVTSGIISGIGREISAGDQTQGTSETLQGVIQTDAAINPGNSGGPLIDINGNVIGINTAIDEQGQSVGFAIAANAAINDIASFQKNGKIIHPFLGVRYQMITQEMADNQKLARNYGAIILPGSRTGDYAVQPGSPADKAGLAAYDIIESINGTEVNEKNTLSSLLSSFNPGDTVSLKVFHQGGEKTLQVTLSKAE